MAIVNYTTFSKVSNLGKPLLLNQLETNMKMFLDWSFLNIGGWNDATIPTSGIYGGDFHILRCVNDPQYTDGQVWQGLRKDWIWESGLNTVPQPISITGVEVNGIGQSTGYHIDYPLGRVIFDTAIDTDYTVGCSHSYKSVQVYVADDVPWFRELQARSFRADDIHFIQDEQRGDWSIGGQHRIQMPAVIVESVSRGTSRGYEVGNGALLVKQDMLFHVLADSRYDRNNILDILRYQSDLNIWLFDNDSMMQAGVVPLNSSGVKINTLVYPNFVSETGYRWKKCRFTNSMLTEVETVHPQLFEGTVRSSLEVIIGTV